MDILGICVLAVTAASVSVLIKRYHGEYSLLLSLICGACVLFVVLQNLSPVAEEVDELLVLSGIPQEYILILFKSIGICYVTQFASDTCKDAGETSLASKAELAGRIAILVVSLPLVTETVSTALSLAGG